MGLLVDLGLFVGEDDVRVERLQDQYHLLVPGAFHVAPTPPVGSVPGPPLGFVLLALKDLVVEGLLGHAPLTAPPHDHKANATRQPVGALVGMANQLEGLEGRGGHRPIGWDVRGRLGPWGDGCRSARHCCCCAGTRGRRGFCYGICIPINVNFLDVYVEE
jgi:hypothetical protein